MFADDLNIVVTADSDEKAERAAQSMCNLADEWALEHHLAANLDKSSVMVISRAGLRPTRASPPSTPWAPHLTLSGAPLSNTTSQKMLGLVIDSGLTFREHCELVAARVARRARALLALNGQKWGPACSSGRTLYLGMVEPAAGYAIPVWFPYAPKSCLQKIQKLLLNAARIVTGAPPYHLGRSAAHGAWRVVPR